MPRSIRTRLALATSALVATTGALVVGGVYLATVESLRRDSQAATQSEIDSLLQSFRSGGLDALVGEVARREGDPALQGFAYLVAEQREVRVAGNVRAWPHDLSEGSQAGPTALEVRRSNVWLVHPYRLDSVRLDGRRSLLVGHDVSAQTPALEALRATAIGGVLLTLLLAIGAGLAMSRRLLGRVEDMRATIAAIRGGQRQGRVALSGSGDEFDELATQFNRLLDENDRLVAQVRDVTNDVAHDLRTPLQRIRGRLEAALANPAETPAARHLLEELAADTERLLDIFNGLLQLAQLESDELRRSMQPIDVAGVVREVAELFGPLAEEAGRSLETATDADLWIHADRELLAQALVNLVDNALKYGAGETLVSARRSGDGVEIAVADRGPGIPPDARERVLGRLVRLDASRGIPGTGLGLSLVAAVARLHRGTIRLEDNAPGLLARLWIAADPKRPPAEHDAMT